MPLTTLLTRHGFEGHAHLAGFDSSLRKGREMLTHPSSIIAGNDRPAARPIALLPQRARVQAHYRNVQTR
jgi:hypothetical protein